MIERDIMISEILTCDLALFDAGLCQRRIAPALNLLL
jgi:hypothetical protein